jgi:subtilisin family serine protease
MAHEYRVAGKTIRLEPDPSVVAVRFQNNLPNSSRARAAEAAAGVGPFSTRFEIPGERLTIMPVRPPATGGPGPAAALQALDAQPEIAKALPVFRMGGNRVVPSDRVILGLKDGADQAAILARYNLTPIREREGEVLARIPDDADVFDLCARLDADGAVEFAEPDFVTIGRHIPRRTGSLQPSALDPMAGDQYAMRITRAEDALEVQQGRPEVRIAVLDEGVDTRHLDLAAAVVARYDAVDDDAYQEPNAWDGHGTSCAGLAAAVPNNALGIRGAGAGCSLLAVRIAYSAFNGGDWITTNENIARAIDWSWREGRADVLSNSWGGGAPSNAIVRAFERARTQGRDGLGCVLVIAAGNEFGPVSFPGTLRNVLTVSASNEFDEIKTPTSSDGETWWGTNHGPEVSVAAPGVHNLTTDISGASGYAAGDYTPTFNGTSSATPIVAGACGLIISAAPRLREDAVRALICDNADKIGPFPYKDGRNDFFGCGRLNVLNSVQAARAGAVAAAPRAMEAATG